MELRPEDITIAITVYNRRDYVLNAIESALNQTIPVKVIVVEDCGPDPTLQDFVLGKFGGQIEYFRNSRNRGLFDNWNACMECCRTPWFSILHDDDWLLPNFIETMLDLVKQAPGRGLYYGRIDRLMPDGSMKTGNPVSWSPWRDLAMGTGLSELTETSMLGYPGQLISVANAKSIGGFRKNSYYTGDWDMWFRMSVSFGGVESSTVVAVARCHESFGRASQGVIRKGWKWLLDNVQRKRNYALLQKERGVKIAYDRTKPLKDHPIPLRNLLCHARGYSQRVLDYNWWLLTHSQPPHWRYAFLQWLIKFLGPQSLRCFSSMFSRRDRC